MNILLLSGESISNKSWIEEVNASLAPLFSRTAILYYDHWQTGQEGIDFEKEYKKLISLAQNLNDYIIFAKSIGTVLTIRGIYERQLKPAKCMFVGPAFIPVEKNYPDFGSWLENYSVPTLFITKTADPVAPAALLQNLLAKYHVRNFKFIEIRGDDHKYTDIASLKSYVSDFTADFQPNPAD